MLLATATVGTGARSAPIRDAKRRIYAHGVTRTDAAIAEPRGRIA
jgi:hypothetical protein